MKEVILSIIEFLKEIVNRLEEAYDTTWGCNDLAEEFNDEVSIRRSINKENFIGFAAGVYTFEAAKEGIMLSENIARQQAEQKFVEGVEKGHFDELYKLKGEKNEPKQ